ncbi:MAG: ATP-binding protein [Desulfatiglandaceae bacterium]
MLLEKIFFNIASPILYMDPEFHLILVNKAFAAWAGHPPEFFVGKRYFDLYPDTRREAIFTRAVQTAERYFALQEDFQHAANDTYWDWTLQPVTDDHGKVIGLILNLVEVTEQKLARQQWRLYRKKLERSNQDLQDFAYTASHDLQEPLRKVRAFGDLLKRRFGETLEADGLDYLQRMVRAAGRMQHLIEALLTYSRVTTQAQPFEKVDLNETIQEALSNLENRIVETGGRVEAGVLSTIDADPYQMIQLFQNLVGNGLKFHRKGVPPKIRLWEESLEETKTQQVPFPPADDFCRILVEDNGIGFDEKHLDRIFAPFQRLHGRSDFDGVGMGLSICQRIVERHQGRITAFSVKGKGSTFIVELPRSQPLPDQEHPTT